MRTVIEDAVVSEIIDRESRNFPRLEDAFDALKWWLSHVPDAGEIIDDFHWLYRQDGDREAGVPSLVVIYIWDNDTIILKYLTIRYPVIS